MSVNDIPALNATLNGTATLLISIGFLLIKTAQKETKPGRRMALVNAHRRVMTAAMFVSAAFLAGYITYHALRRGLHTDFGGTGAIRTLYLTILWTHIPLAALVAYVVPRTFLLAIKGDFTRHRAWARWTFPVWFYVSITGVLVYFFLYQWWPAAKIIH